MEYPEDYPAWIVHLSKVLATHKEGRETVAHMIYIRHDANCPAHLAVEKAAEKLGGTVEDTIILFDKSVDLLLLVNQKAKEMCRAGE